MAVLDAFAHAMVMFFTLFEYSRFNIFYNCVNVLIIACGIFCHVRTMIISLSFVI